MGATESETVKYRSLELVKVLEVHKKIMKCPSTSDIFIQVENTFPTHQQMNEYSAKLKEKLNFSHQYYLSPLTHFLQTHNNLCSKQYRLVQIFPYEPHTLKDEIQNRKQQKKPFNSKDVWSILCSCVLVMAHFSRNQIIHYTLNPKDIVLTEQGQTKILPSQLSEYQFDHNYKSGCFYSPQMLRSLRNAQAFIPTNKSGVFTLGMTILSISISEDLQDIYEDLLIIDSSKLSKKINRVENENIREILKKMLKIAPYERLTFTQIEEMLFFILQKNAHEEEDPVINKLEESILKIRPKTNFISLCPSQKDFEDQPSHHYVFDEVDAQVLDEEESYHAEQLLYQEQTKQCNQKVLTDRSNMMEKQSYLIGSKNYESQKSYQAKEYVTELYSKGRYEGYKENNMRQGFGTFYYDEGGRYTGEWNQNKMQGRGALYYANGDIAYEGEWENDQLHGSGILYNENPVYVTVPLNGKRLDLIDMMWVKYEGSFDRDTRGGKGTIYLTNGESFKGQFLNDMPSGQGTYYGMGGMFYSGIWENGVFV